MHKLTATLQMSSRRTHLARLSLASLLVLAANVVAAPAEDKAAAPTPIVLRASGMIDLKQGRVIPHPVLVIKGDRIESLASGEAQPAGARVIDLGNLTLLPGLIDTHTHLLQNYDHALGGDDPNMALTVSTMSAAKRALLGAKMGREDLEAGITSVRDVGNSGWNGDVALRDAIAKGWVIGPRIFAATRALAPIGGQFGRLAAEAQGIIAQEYAVITGPDEARRAVRQAFYDGADVIKVIVNSNTMMSADELAAIVAEAHKVKKRVAAHATSDAATRLAAEAGVDSIEHGYTISDDALKMMAAKGIFLVPTDFPAEFYGSLEPPPATAEEAKRRLELGKSLAQRSADRLLRAARLGVRIAYGSDEYYDVPGHTRGQASLLTLQAYQEAGLSPLEVLRTATVNAADLLGQGQRLGAIEAGKLADIIAVEGNPLEDVKLLQKVRFVMKGGQIVRHDGHPESLSSSR